MPKKLPLSQIEQYPQLLDELNNLLVQGAEAIIENGRVVITYNEEQTQRAKSRNAGRKVFGPAKAENYKAFYRLYEEGKSMQEISKETGMSLASCYRYKQDAESINEPPEAIGNHKYLLYRAGGPIDRNLRNHELVAVEYGKDIYDVTERLVNAVYDDLSCSEGKIYDVDVYDPEPITIPLRTKRYTYQMYGSIYCSDNRDPIVNYGIIEK